MIVKELRETQNVRGSRVAFSERSQRLQVDFGTAARTGQTESKTNNAAESQSTALATPASSHAQLVASSPSETMILEPNHRAARQLFYLRWQFNPDAPLVCTVRQLLSQDRST